MRRLELAERVIGLRERAGLTQGEAAKRAGVGVTTWSNIETGTITRPHARTVIKMARGLGVDPEDLAVPPSLDWALAAPDEEFEDWAKNADLTEVLVLLRDLHTAVEGTAGEGRAAILERINLVVDRLTKVGGTDPLKLAKRWDTPATDEKQEGREAG